MATSNGDIRIHAIVSGRVQGVGYRYATVVAARRIGVAGWVRNRPDGTVEVEAQGSRAAVAQLISALKAGSPWSRVARVEVEPMPVAAAGADGWADRFRPFSER